MFACQNNKLKNNEKDLAQKILSEEDQIALKESIRLEKEKIWADSIAKLPKGFRFEENRSVDVNHPPKIIDIANRLGQAKSLKLSAVSNKIDYIRMEAVPDASIPNDLGFKYYMMNNYIVGVNIYGIHLFSNKGAFVKTIVKNELTGVKFDSERNAVIITYADYTQKGATTNVWARGDQFYYNYTNSITGQNLIMELDCSQKQIAQNSSFDPENPNVINGLGKVCIDINHGKNEPEKPLYPNGMTIAPIGYFYKQFDVFNPDKNTYIEKLDNENMYAILNTKGDTLACFKKFEQLKNYTKELIRGADFGCQYEKDGNFCFRSDFNDTIFKLTPPNQIQPIYVLNLGQYKVSKQNGLDPDYDLTGKIIPKDWADAKDYVFLRFIKNNTDSPRNRKNKSVEIYHALYSKKTQHLDILESDPTNYDVNLLENDVDGGISVWPESYMINKKGEIMISLKGSDVKDHVLSLEFKNSSAPIQKKEALQQLANTCSDQDNILMLVQ
ncbi:hypothetical protein BZG02_12815 [Labilibaculum filiforme]|uniref:Uncharacterized protein n=1 Tax=Labilibaculum filiforme TaxID=1940526 RepID=A0A2N3HX37_9BACT|nr:hypothetical protein BZG02_12815 [Labilibaculum filiforme]